MSIVEFPRRATLHGEWRPDEWQQLVALFLPNAATVGITWDVGSTERSDPQFYLLGPGPDRDCVLCVSRLAQGYVLEDGEGRLIGEAPSLDQLAEQTARAAVRGGRSFIARVAGGFPALQQAGGPLEEADR
ncbi:MAG: hypothetical protein JNK47_23520 [Mesorhizobium sp.]|nr:hypothetical protein [Mesorhizobium sp.]MBL8580178.1 hypothetical protein [Mesorhizobium sp.]